MLEATYLALRSEVGAGTGARRVVLPLKVVMLVLTGDAGVEWLGVATDLIRVWALALAWRPGLMLALNEV